MVLLLKGDERYGKEFKPFEWSLLEERAGFRKQEKQVSPQEQQVQ
jgi:hypothetical protein